MRSSAYNFSNFACKQWEGVIMIFCSLIGEVILKKFNFIIFIGFLALFKKKFDSENCLVVKKCLINIEINNETILFF